MLFVDFEKAFDCVDKEVLWNILRAYVIPAKYVQILGLESCIEEQSAKSMLTETSLISDKLTLG